MSRLVMTGTTTRRWADAGTTWFAISGVGPELASTRPSVRLRARRRVRLEIVTWEGWQLRVPRFTTVRVPPAPGRQPRPDLS